MGTYVVFRLCVMTDADKYVEPTRLMRLCIDVIDRQFFFEKLQHLVLIF